MSSNDSLRVLKGCLVAFGLLIGVPMSGWTQTTFLLHTGTALIQAEDANGDFLLGEFDHDGVPDLYFIKRRNTGTNSIEVHVLNGASNYQQFALHTGTPLVQAEDGNGDYLLGDFDRDGVPDLYFIKRRNTGTNSIEVHVLNGASNYQQFALHTGTTLLQAEDGNGDYLLGDFDRDGVPDLYFIKRRNTGTNSIEVHVLSGASNYQQFALHTGTTLLQAEDGNGDYLLGDFDGDGVPDLYFIKRRNTGTNSIEVHVLSGASNYQQFALHTGTALVQAEDGNGDFRLGDFDRDGVPDLYFIKRRNTGTNSIEVHVLLIRLAVPQVEIRINEFPAGPSATDNPADDYLTWAPTFAMARIDPPVASNVNVVLTNDTPNKGGDVAFAANVVPWPVNTTATANTLTLTLPAAGGWVPFVVAGKFGSPSINDKDAIIEAHQNTAGGAILGTKALMVRVRKNANNLTPSERSRFLFAWRNFRNSLGDNYLQFQEMHRFVSTAGDEGHRQPAFLPWHRAMLLHVERELQKIDPSVALHYWNWDAAAPNVFTQDFMGAPDTNAGQFNIAEPIFAPANPLNGWNTDLPFSGGELRRNGGNHTAAPIGGTFKPMDHPVDDSLVDRVNYGPRVNFDSFSTEVETRSHNPAHGWTCGGGNITAPVRSASDPLFYLLHSHIDRQWAYWQWKQNRHGTIAGGALTFPAPAHYDNNGNWNDPGVTQWQKGSFLEDGMWPWDGTSGGAAGRAERPLNQAASPGPDTPISRPLVPSTQFPASVRQNLWPLGTARPAPRHMIDYHGRFRVQDGLGFSYDDVPY